LPKHGSRSDIRHRRVYSQVSTIYILLWEVIKQKFGRNIQRMTTLLLLFLLNLFQPKNCLHPLPHNTVILSKLVNSVNFRNLLMQPIHLLLLRVLQVRTSCTRLPYLLHQHTKFVNPPIPSFQNGLTLFILSLQFMYPILNLLQIIGQSILRRIYCSSISIIFPTISTRTSSPLTHRCHSIKMILSQSS